jgi:ribosomal protein S18 acetylase RimI-like enzyme
LEPKIARIGLAEFAAEREALVALLTDTVESGAAVGFLPPLDAETADAYWTSVGAAIGQSGRTLFGLWAAGVLAATVQLQRASMPNGRHRGEVMKLMVHRRYRGRGFAGMLMSAMEAEARRQGLRLLVLDTRQGDTAEGLYRKLGWQESGVIPGYAESADGSLHATVIFYKELR